jgi:hypothetical protein
MVILLLFIVLDPDNVIAVTKGIIRAKKGIIRATKGIMSDKRKDLNLLKYEAVWPLVQP